MFNPAEIDTILGTMEIIVDTREQPNNRYQKRIKELGCPIIRQKLDAGDYSFRFTTPDGVTHSGEKIAVVERKMSLDELCSCYTTGRGRFEREFQRAARNGTRIHLVIENGSLDKMYHGDYRSRLNAKSFTASAWSWTRRYNIHLHFCSQNSTAQVIRDILYYELREYLKTYDELE